MPLGFSLNSRRMNINRPFVINSMRDYLLYAKYIAMSRHHRPVDDRIRACIKGFTITGEHIRFGFNLLFLALIIG